MTFFIYQYFPRIILIVKLIKIYIYMLDENQRENKDKYDKMSKMKI